MDFLRAGSPPCTPGPALDAPRHRAHDHVHHSPLTPPLLPRRALALTLDPIGAGLYETTETFYEEEVPFELRARIFTATDTPQNVYQLETVRVKLIASHVGASLRSLTVELTTDADLWFHHTHVMNVSTFRATQHAQALSIDFADYPAILARMFDACIAERNCAVFTIGNDGVSQLHIVQARAELLTVEFAQSSEETVRLAVMERYNALRAHRAEEQARRLRDSLISRELWSQPAFFLNAGRT
jgi:hypothetical protein